MIIGCMKCYMLLLLEAPEISLCNQCQVKTEKKIKFRWAFYVEFRPKPSKSTLRTTKTSFESLLYLEAKNSVKYHKLSDILKNIS